MEQKFSIDTFDGFKIYGVINTNPKKKNTKAILHIHGLTGDVYGYAPTRMALSFPKFGYDVIRIYLYTEKENARRLIDCTIKQHAKDIDTVVKHFQKRYKKIFATGHSYGGPSLMMSKINQFAAVSLWDPTYLPSKSVLKSDFTKIGNYYISPEGVALVVGKDFLDEAESFDRKQAISLSKKCQAPLQVIYGGKDPYWLPEGESFHTNAKGPTDERVIKSSQHCFYEEASTAPLLRYTRQWFDRF